MVDDTGDVDDLVSVNLLCLHFQGESVFGGVGGYTSTRSTVVYVTSLPWFISYPYSWT